MLDEAIAIRAARNYRLLRTQGITVRKTIDMIIGTFCVTGDHLLLHDDRDFDPMTEHLGLRVVRIDRNEIDAANDRGDRARASTIASAYTYCQGDGRGVGELVVAGETAALALRIVRAAGGLRRSRPAERTMTVS